MIASTVLLASLVLSSCAEDAKPPGPKDGSFGSERPLYFRVGFGREGKISMLGVVDESKGTGKGYDVAYVDENMNGDLLDEAAKPFPRRQYGSRKGVLEPRFEFEGPFRKEGRAKYKLNIYSLGRDRGESTQENDYYFFWYLDTKEWHYFFINGKMRLFSSAAEALEGKPLRLGGDCKWEISSRIRGSETLVSAGLKDDNGCTLRSVTGRKGRLSPVLTLSEDGTVKKREKMEFG